MHFSKRALIGLSGLAFSFLTSASIHYPCSGAPGSFRANPDQSQGGFVAATAAVDSSVFLGPETSVCDRATVIEGAKVLDKAVISGKATVRGAVIVSNEAEIFGEAYVINPSGGHLLVKDQAKIYGHGFLQGSVVVGDTAEVFGWGKVIEFAQVLGNSKVCGRAIVKDFEVINNDNSKCVLK